jgi:O-antigen/teichoic acid export membrane protein
MLKLGLSWAVAVVAAVLLVNLDKLVLPRMASSSFVNVLAYMPHAVLVVRGRTDALAKAYWIELAFFAVAALVLTKLFGIVGASFGLGLRAVFDTFLTLWLANR